MTNSDEWARQDTVDQKADEYLATTGYDISEVRGNDIAKHFSLHANNSFYTKFYDWRERRLAEANHTPFDIAPEALSAFLAEFEKAKAALTAAYMKSVREVGVDAKRTIDSLILSGERHKKITQGEVGDLLSLCGELEANLTEANARIEDLVRALDVARDRENQLQGRIEQCQIELRNAQADSRDHAPKQKGKSAAAKTGGAAPAPSDDAPLLAAIKKAPGKDIGDPAPERADPGAA